MVTVYFFHTTRTPHNVRMTWDMPQAPAVGEEIKAPEDQSVYVVTRVRWTSASSVEVTVTEAAPEGFRES